MYILLFVSSWASKPFGFVNKLLLLLLHVVYGSKTFFDCELSPTDDSLQSKKLFLMFLSIWYGVCLISDVLRSILGSVVWIAVIVTWVVIFQLKRAEWGASADYISFIIPKGEP